jgi:hypothetical protein
MNDMSGMMGGMHVWGVLGALLLVAILVALVVLIARRGRGQ